MWWLVPGILFLVSINTPRWNLCVDSTIMLYGTCLISSLFFATGGILLYDKGQRVGGSVVMATGIMSIFLLPSAVSYLFALLHRCGCVCCCCCCRYGSHLRRRTSLGKRHARPLLGKLPIVWSKHYDMGIAGSNCCIGEYFEPRKGTNVLKALRDCLVIKLHGKDLPRTYPNAPPSTYFKVVQGNTVICNSETVGDSENPQWREVRIKIGSIDVFAPMEFHIFEEATNQIIATKSIEYTTMTQMRPFSEAELVTEARLEDRYGHDSGIHKRSMVPKIVFAKVRVETRRTFDKMRVHEVPHKATQRTLLLHHTPGYLARLHSATVVANITELPLCCVPSLLLKRGLLDPMLYMTQGTIQACELALRHNWAVNLGGGFHHAAQNCGGAFSVYADIPIAIKHLWSTQAPHEAKLKVLVVNLSAQRGLGVENSLRGEMKRGEVFVLDMYNPEVYPHAEYPATRGRPYQVDWVGLSLTENKLRNPLLIPIHPEHSRDHQSCYIILRKVLAEVKAAFRPDLIIYCAGSDIMAADPWGGLLVQERGLVYRDQIVFESAMEGIDGHTPIPIAMLLSTGYQVHYPQIIAKSIGQVFENSLTQRGELVSEVGPRKRPGDDEYSSANMKISYPDDRNSIGNDESTAYPDIEGRFLP